MLINIRAWDEQTQAYYQVEQLNPLSGIVKLVSDDNRTLIRSLAEDNLDLELATGLIDAKGTINSSTTANSDTTIYEGDIVQPVHILDDNTLQPYNEAFAVKPGNYAYGKFIAENIANSGFGVDNWYNGNELRIIGNIHQS